MRGQIIKAFVVNRDNVDRVSRDLTELREADPSCALVPRAINSSHQCPRHLRAKSIAGYCANKRTKAYLMSSERTDRFPTITDKGLESLRRRIGVRIESDLEPWCYEATRDNIRHYAHGIGDDNPLWCDPGYASQTRHGGLIAPPSFLFACSRIISGYVGGLPGVHAMWAGADWHWERPIHRNDELRTESWLKDLIVRETQFAGRAVQQIYHVDFFNQDGDKLAGADSWCFRTERDTARESGTKYDELKEKPERRYSPDELADFFNHYAGEQVRGSDPRYFDDVKPATPSIHR